MKEWLNEWVSEWMNEWMNEWVNYKGDVMTIMTWLPITGGVFRILSDIIRWSFLILNSFMIMNMNNFSILFLSSILLSVTLEE